MQLSHRDAKWHNCSVTHRSHGMRKRRVAKAAVTVTGALVSSTQES